MYQRGNLISCLEVRTVTEFSQEFFSHSGKDLVLCLAIEHGNQVDLSSFPATNLKKQIGNRSRALGNIGQQPRPTCAASFSHRSIFPKNQIIKEYTQKPPV